MFILEWPIGPHPNKGPANTSNRLWLSFASMDPPVKVAKLSLLMKTEVMRKGVPGGQWNPIQSLPICKMTSSAFLKLLLWFPIYQFKISVLSHYYTETVLQINWSLCCNKVQQNLSTSSKSTLPIYAQEAVWLWGSAGLF